MAELFIDLAQESDIAELNAFIQQSAFALCARYYEPEAVAAAIEHVFGVDSQLVRSETYYVARVHGQIVGCGGWSPYATLFGADQADGRDDRRLDPDHDAARIRAFFVSPDWTRAGIGSALLETCEAAADMAGFSSAELMATLSGVPFYEARGYHAVREQLISLGDIRIRFIQMRKSLRIQALGSRQPDSRLRAFS